MSNLTVFETDKELDFRQMPAEDEILVGLEPIAVRLNCKTGDVIFQSDDTFIGKTLEFDLFAAKHFRDANFFPRWYEPQDWLQIVAIDEKRRLITFLIRGRSLSSFNVFNENTKANGVSLFEVKVKASFTKHSHEEGDYYSVKFEKAGESVLVEAKEKLYKKLGEARKLMYLNNPGPEFSPEYDSQKAIEGSHGSLEKRVQLIRGPVENGID